MVPTVPMTPTRPERVTRAAARMPGATTPMTGMSYRASSVSSPTDAALLHATTRSFTPRSTSRSPISSAYFVTSSPGLGPYGNRPVSPK